MGAQRAVGGCARARQWVVGLSALCLVLAACNRAPSGPPLPPVVPAERFTGEVAQAYTLAAKNAPLLAQLHCHCGCEQQEGHHNLLECFTTAHAASCEICMNEVRDADMMATSGLDAEEIAAAIESKYGHLERDEE